MKKTGKRSPMRLLSLLLAVVLFVGTVPFAAVATGAVEEPVAFSECTVTAHGGVVRDGKSAELADGKTERGTVVTVTLDEAFAEGHTFVCWRADDGTEIPQKSFRVLVERSCAFYPVFSDVTGNFGEWVVFFVGELCTDGTIYVREDMETGLKEFKFERGRHHYGELYEQLDERSHKGICSVCGYVDSFAHWFDDGVITTAPTHTEEGVKLYTCRYCGYTKTEPVPISDFDHTYGEWEIVTEAKDGQPGSRKKTCACGDTVEGYYIKAEWEKYYKGLNVEMETMDGVFGRTQNEWHYSFSNEDGDDVYIYLLKRSGRSSEDWANYGFMFVDDHTNALKPVYIMKNRARYGQFAVYNGYTWSQLAYARSVEEYVEIIDGLLLYGGGATQNYSSQLFDAFRAWETVYNAYPKYNPEWYIDAGYTRTERTYLGYDCWEYKKAGSISYYDDVYYVVKSDNTCLYAKTGASQSGYSVDAIKEMFYDATLPAFEDSTAEYEWRNTHCAVSEIGTAKEQLNRTEITFSTTAPERENAAGYRFCVLHVPLVRGSATPQYGFYGRGGEDDHSGNFDIIPKNQDITDYDVMNNDSYAVTLIQMENDNFDFDHWEKYDWESGTWSVYEGPLKFNYVVAEKDPDGNDKRYEDGHKNYLEDHRLTEIQYFRGIYNLKTRHVKVEGGTFMFNGERVSEADVPHGTVISLSYTSKEGYDFDGFEDSDGKVLYYADYSSIKVEKDMTYTARFSESVIHVDDPYLDANAENGSVLVNGEEFWGGSFKSGTALTLTTTGNEGYPYFLGWYVMDKMSGTYKLYSNDITLNFTITEYTGLVARWSKTETEPKFNITIVNGFARSGYEMLAVSAVSVPEERDVQLIKDPTVTSRLTQWVISGTLDNGKAYDGEPLEYSERGNGLYPYNIGVDYPRDMTITGELFVCEAHDWDEGVVTKAPTYTEYGVMTYTCRICGAQKTEAIPQLPRYCVHACGNCGGCTLPADDTSCDFKRCSCTDSRKLPTQNGPHIGFSSGSGEIYTVLYEEQPENPYVKYVLSSTEGYDVKEIYDISYNGAIGAGENVTVTLTVGGTYAKALDEGKMCIIHVAKDKNVIYGRGHEPITVDVAAGTVTFTVDSFSPFVLASGADQTYTVSGNAKSFLDATADVTLELIPAGETAAAHTVTVKGNDAAYSIPNVAAGTYTLRVSKTGHVTREYSVTVGSDSVALDVEIWRVGDVTGDGVLDITDAVQITRKYNGKPSVFGTGDEQTEAYRSLVANVYSADGPTIDITDVTQIKRKYNGKPSVIDVAP